MEHRKLIKFGNSSHVVSLPNVWLKKNGLNKGDVLYFKENGNNELVLSSEIKENKKEVKEITLNIDGKDINLIEREIISAYINNFSIIKIFGEGLKKNDKKIRDIIQDLMALEVIEETSNTMIAKDFLDLKEIHVRNLFRKIDLITRCMIKDTELMLEGKDNYENILNRDKNVNRLFYLIIRTIKYSLNNATFAKSVGIANTVDLLKYWDIASYVEKIADQTKRNARYFKRLKSSSSLKSLVKIYSQIEQTYLKTMEAYYNKDVNLAFKLSFKKREIATNCNNFYLRHWNKKWVPIITENFKNMVASIHNIGRRVYS